MPSQDNTSPARRDVPAFGLGVVVGIVGGLIGLGGAEFRLPLLVGYFRFRMLLAVVINLVVSLVTVIFSLIFRAQSQGLAPIAEQWPVALNVLAGSLIGSYAGVHFATRISEKRLTRAVAIILALLGLTLIAHDWLFAHDPLTTDATLRIILGFIAGLIIGTVSSLLGVAGGELIIPTLVLLFGLDIRLAGSVSLAISIPTVIVGIIRYRSRPVFGEITPHRRLIVLMAIGSTIGALIGSRLLPYVSSMALQIVLGMILIFSAIKMALKKMG